MHNQRHDWHDKRRREDHPSQPIAFNHRNTHVRKVCVLAEDQIWPEADWKEKQCCDSQSCRKVELIQGDLSCCPAEERIRRGKHESRRLNAKVQLNSRPPPMHVPASLSMWGRASRRPGIVEARTVSTHCDEGNGGQQLSDNPQPSKGSGARCLGRDISIPYGYADGICSWLTLSDVFNLHVFRCGQPVGFVANRLCGNSILAMVAPLD